MSFLKMNTISNMLALLPLFILWIMNIPLSFALVANTTDLGITSVNETQCNDIDCSPDPQPQSQPSSPIIPGLCFLPFISCPAPQTCCTFFCVTTDTNPLNCGRCGNRCSIGFTCVAGTCTCQAPRTLCNGVCTDTRTDRLNCGACGQVCAPGVACVNGVCAAA